MSDNRHVTQEREAPDLNAGGMEGDRLVNKVRSWIESQKHLHARTDSQFILRFLQGCKYNVEKAQWKIMNYYTIRTKVPEWFTDRDPLLPQNLDLIKLGVFIPLRDRDSQGRLVVIIRTAAHDPHRHLQNDVFKVGKMILDLVLEQDETISLYGVVAIFDLTGVTIGHAMQLTPSIIKRAVHTWQDCYPVSPKRLDFIKAPVYVNVVLNIFKTFMRDKIRKRVFVHSGQLNQLHKHVSPNILPREYGGTNGNICDLIEFWKEEVIAKREWYIEDEQYKAQT